MLRGALLEYTVVLGAVVVAVAADQRFESANGELATSEFSWVDRRGAAAAGGRVVVVGLGWTEGGAADPTG